MKNTKGEFELGELGKTILALMGLVVLILIVGTLFRDQFAQQMTKLAELFRFF